MKTPRRAFLRRLGAGAAGLALARRSRADSAAAPGDGAAPATGRADPALAPFDRLMQSFIRERGVPGAALAVARQGRLVYARGFGLADREARAPVQPDSLFRIASVSKPLTSAAVLQCVEKGRLRLDSLVTDVLELASPADPRWRRITILNLLQHTGGWDSAASGDPMFRSVAIAQALGVPPPALPPHIIRFMAGKPLDFDPGSRMAYSNFGYCLLGRVLERASGMGYEDYVRQHVLAPLGIRSMRLGKTLPAGRAAGEVAYYAGGDPGTGPAVMGPVGQPVPLPYGAWCLEAMDAHGGWVAPAAELVRFACAFDRPERCPILRPGSIAAAFARPPGAAGFEADGRPRDAYYGCGWCVRPAGGGGRANTWHTGSLDGTSSLLVRRHDGLNWAVLFNTRLNTGGAEPAQAIDGPLHAAADAVQRWPDIDLFARPPAP